MEGFFTFNNLVLLGTYIITGSSFYWKMKIDIAALNLKIEELKEDRVRKWDEQKEKWRCHDEAQIRNDDKFSDLLAVMGDVKTDVGIIKEALSFLKQK